MKTAPFKFKVNIFESERGWGQSLIITKEFSSYEEAMEELIRINSQNNLPEVPDYYVYAEPVNFIPN